MSVEKRQLINNDNGQAFFPIAHTEATYDANGNTVEQRLTQETTDREAADIDLQRDVAELQNSSARIDDGTDPDFAITDESGNSIVQFANGDVKTKNFDSSEVQQDLSQVQQQMGELSGLPEDVENLQETSPLIDNDSLCDFSLSDENGNTIAQFVDGHVKTKKFDSHNTTQTENNYVDFAISDENGNSVVEFANGHVRTKKFDSSNVSSRKNIKMLAIGNSFSYDAFQYLPPLLKDMADIDITLGILYRASCTVLLHEDFIRNDKVKQGAGTDGYQLFSRYDPKTMKWTTAYIDPPKASSVIPSEDWDIITLQQDCYEYEGNNPYDKILPYLTSIIDMLIGGVNDTKMTNNTKFAWVITPSAPTTRGGDPVDMDAIFTAEAVCAQNVLRDTVFDFVIPCGTAIHNARHTSLNNLGDAGNMTLDDLHLQGGLPMLIESYVAALKILEVSGFGEKGIIGNRIRPTTEWELDQALPSRRGTPVGVNDENIMLGQKCAIWAIKKPYEITENIESSNI